MPERKGGDGCFQGLLHEVDVEEGLKLRLVDLLANLRDGNFLLLEYFVDHVRCFVSEFIIEIELIWGGK